VGKVFGAWRGGLGKFHMPDKQGVSVIESLGRLEKENRGARGTGRQPRSTFEVRQQERDKTKPGKRLTLVELGGKAER